MIHIYSEPSQKFALFSSDVVRDPISFAKKSGDSKCAEYLFRPSHRTEWLVELRDSPALGESDVRLMAMDEPGREFLRELALVSGKLSPEDGCNLVFTLLDPAARAKQVAGQLAAQDVSAPVLSGQPSKGHKQPLWILVAALVGAVVMFLVWMAVDFWRPHSTLHRGQSRSEEGRKSR